MPGESRTINAIAVPIKTDMSPFSKGLARGRKEADKFVSDSTRSFSLMGKGITESVAKAHAKLEDLGRTNLGVVTKGMAGLAAAAAASTAAIATLGFKNISELGRDAVTLGTSAEALSRLRSVAKGAGVDVKDLDEFMKGLTSSVHDSIGRTTAAGEAMKSLGTSAQELSKLTPEEQIRKLNEGFAALPDEAARARVAMQLAGSNGIKAFRMLAMGSADFKKSFDSAPIVTDEEVSEIQKLQRSINKLVETFEAMANTITATVAPAITEVVDSVKELVGMMATFFPRSAKPMASGKIGDALKSLGGPKPPAVAGPGASKTSAPVGPDPEKLKAERAAREQEAAEAKSRVDELQKRFDKEAEGLRLRPGHLVGRSGTNGMGWRVEMSNQKALDRHSQTAQMLNEAKNNAQRLADAAKTTAGAMSDAMRTNTRLLEEVAGLKQEYRSVIESAGKDEIHRRVDQIKGLSDSQRKQLIAQGYQAREAGKTSALRDELQESTKLPIEKLGEDLARINRMAQLGAANGGLSRAQALRAAAQKTAEAGVAGTQTQFAGALSANSIEGRSYLLSQTIGRPDDMLETARKGLEATMQGNGFLASIARDLRQTLAQKEVMASF